MTKLIIELPSWEVNKNDLAEIANKMQAIELSFNDLINDIPFEDYTIEANLSDLLEVVTREVAISNDKELLSMSGSGYTKSEIENDYEVGGALSGYKIL